MKLLICTDCQSVVSLTQDHARSCECGNVKGMYIDELNARFRSINDCYLMVGFANYTVQKAIQDYRKHGSPDGMGLNFTAFIIPEPCKTFIQVSEEEFEECVDVLNRCSYDS